MEFCSLESTHRIIIDDSTGLPSELSLSVPVGGRRVGIKASVACEVDGTECRGSTGGIEYLDTHRLTECARIAEPTMHQTPKGCTWRVPVHVSGDSGEGGVSGEILYHLNRLGPSCSLGFEFIGDQMIVVRNFVLIMTLQLGDGKWFVTAPGNGFAGDTPLETISSAVGISPIGGLRGSSGLVHLEPEDLADSAVSLWFDNDVEIPEIDVLGASESSVTSSLITNFAADLAHTTANELQLCSIDVDVPRWSRFPALFDGWLRSRGHTSPGDAPDWVASAMIYEAQIGFSVFAQTNHYSPYPEVTDLTSDLDRICGLGFTVIQLMPRQPYPSYNIHDFWNVDVSYGPRAMLIAAASSCAGA